MTIKARTIGLFVTTAALQACATPVTPRYAANTDNVLAFRNLGATGIYVGEITEPAKDDIKCRGIGRMRLQDGSTHAQFVRHALTDELKLAGSYSGPPGRVALTGALEEIDSKSGIGDGRWSMTLVLRSTNGQSMRVSNVYNFRAGFAATAACNNVAAAFVPAVQDLINKAVIDKRFVDLVRK